MRADTAIIVLNWNGLKHLNDCFGSIAKQTYDAYQTIMVDNGSSDDSVVYVQKNFPDVKIISTGKNLGFAEGNNVGFRAVLRNSEIKYVIALNNDTEVESTWLEELVKVVEMDETIGAVASKMKMFSERDMIDSAGDFLQASSFKVVTRGYREKDTGQYDRIEECFTARAGAALYRREMLEETALGEDYFDSHYFAYIEDTDLSIRARLAGWKIMYAPAAVVYHKVSATTSTLPNMFGRFHSGRNRIFTAIKNLPISMWTAAIRQRRSVDEVVGTSLVSSIWLYVRIVVAVIMALPRLLHQRKEIAKTRIVSSNDIVGWQKDFEINT